MSSPTPDREPPPAAEPADVRLGWFEHAVGFHLRRAQEASFAAFKQRVGQVDIRAGHFAAIVLIGQNPGITQTALGKAMGRDKSSLTPILEDLVRRDFVLRERSDADRRRYGLTLSSHGQQAWSSLERCAAEHERELARCIEPEDRERFLQILQRIASVLPPSSP
ncbi:MarR family transcriptional regulator [Achromobacter sp. GG226]|uniref:MarR family winged helix-turn-helix transcriptional regulator n=1 Tax=Verticiella alkaliphila TaxID=2779529 RepID=UPI001C0ACDBC|nr:MarR family transcriptional regulator [Verticiella sp. GG226]